MEWCSTSADHVARADDSCRAASAYGDVSALSGRGWRRRRIPCWRARLPRRATAVDHPMAVRVAAGGQAGPTGAALGRGAAGALEPGACGRQLIEVGRAYARHAVTAQMLPEVMAGDHKDVRRTGRWPAG